MRVPQENPEQKASNVAKDVIFDFDPSCKKKHPKSDLPSFLTGISHTELQDGWAQRGGSGAQQLVGMFKNPDPPGAKEKEVREVQWVNVGPDARHFLGITMARTVGEANWTYKKTG